MSNIVWVCKVCNYRFDSEQSAIDHNNHLENFEVEFPA